MAVQVAAGAIVIPKGVGNFKIKLLGYSYGTGHNGWFWAKCLIFPLPTGGRIGSEACGGALAVGRSTSAHTMNNIAQAVVFEVIKGVFLDRLYIESVSKLDFTGKISSISIL